MDLNIPGVERITETSAQLVVYTGYDGGKQKRKKQKRRETAVFPRQCVAFPFLRA